MGMMQRTGADDLWRNTLAQIPSRAGQLVYLASLRDTSTGQYRHLGLESRVGPEEADQAIRRSHERLFRDWLRLPMEEKREDLVLHLSAMMEKPALAARNWLNARTYMSMIPAVAGEAEREDFRLHAEITLEWITRGAGGGASDPDA